MARPRKAAEEQRSENRSVRFTTAEIHFLEDQADAAGTTLTDLVRRRALKLPTAPPSATRKPAANAALVSELNRIGVNLNQLARAANRGVGEEQKWDELAARLSSVLERLVLPHGS